MRPESAFWQRIRGPLAKHAPGDWQRHEPGTGGIPGVPDVNACVRGREFWVELKVVARGKQVGLRPSQVAWHTRRAQHGGRSWILANVVRTGEIWLWPGRDARAVLEHGLDQWPRLALPGPWDFETLARELRKG